MKTQSGFFKPLTPARAGQKKLSLFSPLTLLALVAILFIFFLTASGDSKYFTKGAGWNKAVMEKDLNRCDSETLYRSIVTNGDAIRSVLQ